MTRRPSGLSCPRVMVWFVVVVGLCGAGRWGVVWGASGGKKEVTVKVRADSQATGYPAAFALDGRADTFWHTAFGQDNPQPPHTLYIDLGGRYELTGFTYRPRPGGGNGSVGRYEFYLGDDPQPQSPCQPVVCGRFKKGAAVQTVRFDRPVTGRYVRFVAVEEVNGRPWASAAELQLLCETAVFRAHVRPDQARPTPQPGRAAARRPGASRPAGLPDDPQAVGLTGELYRQYLMLLHDLSRRRRFAQLAPEAWDRQALIVETDRDPLDVVLRRTAALLADISAMAGAPDLSEQAGQLAALDRQARTVPVEQRDRRAALYVQVCRLRRKIAFANPLLNFDRILFLKRHLATFRHMCDQYYGINQRPGGGLFVLTDPFSDHPQVRPLLDGAVVQSGRLKGRKLTGGSFLSPDLSFDAQRVAFAWVACQGSRAHRFHLQHDQGHWDPGWSYHIFTANIDGSNLRMLTDGAFNDFDPCWMPSGRIAFISERRGGYLRCGRVCPTYTLYDMADDGTDIRRLSHHETNEWHPSVTHDGMIVWTRWDYVDRHGQVAHMPWLTTPDGRDPRPLHGNYTLRSRRPDMEQDVRAIPGSHRFVATAAPHHEQSFGSLVIIDPYAPDGPQATGVRRLTPRAEFPESQGPTGQLSYGQAWPLSESYFLCVYSPYEVPALQTERGRHALYLLDRFGNQELLYRDPDIGCHNPIPLRPRPVPPVVAEARQPTPPDRPAHATVAVMNVYNSRRPWPEGTKITALRIYQIYPLSVASARVPHATGMQIPQGRDSINLARSVLGTVPVEPDGSAYFVVPAGKELYFQALDEEGLAVQSMRSGTHFQPGEQATCQGCHEPRSFTPTTAARTVPRAMRRPPSPIRPDVDGTHPFSYPRLVQPVLDRKCVSCHAKNADKAPPLDSRIVSSGRSSYMNPATEYYVSYLSLAPKYGFYDYRGGWSDPTFYQTVPGQFGARASKLYHLLKQGHYDVKLSPDEMHRITVWLDSCSLFYGVYEDEGGKAQLRGEIAWPSLE